MSKAYKLYFLIFVSSFVLPITSFALSCHPRVNSTEERYFRSTYIFLGTVKEIGKMPREPYVPTKGLEYVGDTRVVQIQFQVEEAWKGVDEEVISIGVMAKSLGQYKVGSRFLIFADPNGENGMVSIGHCNGGAVSDERTIAEYKTKLGASKKFGTPAVRNETLQKLNKQLPALNHCEKANDCFDTKFEDLLTPAACGRTGHLIHLSEKEKFQSLQKKAAELKKLAMKEGQCLGCLVTDCAPPSANIYNEKSMLLCHFGKCVQQVKFELKTPPQVGKERILVRWNQGAGPDRQSAFHTTNWGMIILENGEVKSYRLFSNGTERLHLVARLEQPAVQKLISWIEKTPADKLKPKNVMVTDSGGYTTEVYRRDGSSLVISKEDGILDHEYSQNVLRVLETFQGLGD